MAVRHHPSASRQPSDPSRSPVPPAPLAPAGTPIGSPTAPTGRAEPGPSAAAARCLLSGVLALVLALSATTGPGARPAGAAEPATFETVAELDELTGDHARLFRLYWAFFNRQPDAGGALYWIEQHDRCVSLDAIASLFAASSEFHARYGADLGNEAFVDRIYHNVLGRAADSDGLAYWAGLLTDGELQRGGVVLHISMSAEFAGRHPYPSDGVTPRSCHRHDGRPTGRSVNLVDLVPLATVGDLTIISPAAVVERAGFHQSSHPGAQAMTAADPSPVRLTTMASRGRGTHRRGAIDITVEPETAITAPVSGIVARAGNYTLYCRYRDGFAVIKPDGQPHLEVKVLHIQDVAVAAGDRVAAGDVVAARATPFPFRSQIDDLTAEPSWPHVHIEVVDPSIPRKRSGGSC